MGENLTDAWTACTVGGMLLHFFPCVDCFTKSRKERDGERDRKKKEEREGDREREFANCWQLPSSAWI